MIKLIVLTYVLIDLKHKRLDHHVMIEILKQQMMLSEQIDVVVTEHL